MSDQLIEIFPAMPASMARLPELAGNLFFSWNRPSRALFEDLDPVLWTQVGGNPRLMLRCLSQAKLDHAASDPVYLGRYAEVLRTFDAYVGAPPHSPAPGPSSRLAS